MTALSMPEGYDKAEVNRLIRYHSEISYNLTTQRTALESALIPITAYITVACVEAYRRYPEMMVEIAAAMAPEEIGRTGRTVGNEIDTVRMWSIANFHFVGRTVLASAGMLDFEQDLVRTATVLDFWKRAATGFRGADGTLQAADANGSVTPYADLVESIAAQCSPIADADHLSRISRLNALLTSYEFLLWFDTRSGYQDSGPYRLPDGRVLLLRHFVKLGVSDFAWSAKVASDMPFETVLCAFVLRGVEFGVTDFGTAVTEPGDYLPHVEEFSLFNTANGVLSRIGDDGIAELTAAAKSAQRAQYRSIAAMERKEKIDCGAYVYFSFLRPFAVAAGIADQLDWAVPRDSLDLYPFLSLIDGTPEGVDVPDPGAYYVPIP
jgi:hypothetical protein